MAVHNIIHRAGAKMTLRVRCRDIARVLVAVAPDSDLT
ncbi:hypothetical Protein YC6258_05730 [Gynuella sunshinyii YC6258]|uniref:Uncharacterized protein n=1 Tax=Gynuella sunshinyii YC6258 TaxID=1445510 RepID=A0A0C5VWV7_9GAMM|nr:hypothetical Protein YC6258_05730 [Gynuella sunshinyii YC6258]